MDFAGSYTFHVPQDMLWAALQDPVVLGAVVHACSGVEKIRENNYIGTLQFKAGGVQGIFKGTIKLFNVLAPNGYSVEINGTGIPGVVRGTGAMHLETHDQETLMHYEGKVQFGGRIASVGQRMLEPAVRTIIQESFEALDTYLLVELKHQRGGTKPLG